MTRNSKYSALFAALLLAAPLAVPASQDDDHAAHHPGPEDAVPEPGAPDEAPSMGSGMGGMMEMMTPEMMQMMRSMMSRQDAETGRRGMMGEGSMMGPGMGGGGMMGGGMMGEGMMMGPGMMGSGMDSDGMMGRHGPGMHGMRGGHGLLYGMPRGHATEMTPARVRAFLERRLEWHGNPRLAIGEIVELDASTITAEIVTVDGSLVQKLAFNRFPGLVRQLDD